MKLAPLRLYFNVNIRDPFYFHDLTFIPAWINNHMSSKLWHNITYLDRTLYNKRNQLFIHAGIEIKPYGKGGPRWTMLVKYVSCIDVKYTMHVDVGNSNVISIVRIAFHSDSQVCLFGLISSHSHGVSCISNAHVTYSWAVWCFNTLSELPKLILWHIIFADGMYFPILWKTLC